MPLNFQGAKNIQIHNSNIQDIVGNNNIQGQTSYNLNSGNRTTTTNTNSHNDSSTAIGSISNRHSSQEHPAPIYPARFTRSESQGEYGSLATGRATPDQPNWGLEPHDDAAAPLHRSEAHDPHAEMIYGSGTRSKVDADRRGNDSGQASTKTLHRPFTSSPCPMPVHNVFTAGHLPTNPPLSGPMTLKKGLLALHRGLAQAFPPHQRSQAFARPPISSGQALGVDQKLDLVARSEVRGSSSFLPWFVSAAAKCCSIVPSLCTGSAPQGPADRSS